MTSSEFLQMYYLLSILTVGGETAIRQLRRGDDASTIVCWMKMQGFQFAFDFDGRRGDDMVAVCVCV